ncbi:Predicted transcriptional regulator [bacterium A37T11]|nr:Predicted transcriptional regulator [bacterium A37T11]
MMTQKNIKPTDSEMEILQLLWQKGPSSVREIHDELSKTKDAGYTTTLKLMQIMHEKGLVSRDASSKVHIYTAALTQQQAQQQLVTKMIDHMFNGSAARLVMHTIGQKHTSKEEIALIKAYLEELEKDKK